MYINEHMKKTNFFFLIIILFGFKICAQDLTCKDFRTGKFYIPQDDDLREFTISFRDSVTKFMPKRDSTVIRTVVERLEYSQTEWTNGINQGIPKHELVEWIDDCTYRLKYDESRQQLEEMEQWINDNNGLVVSKIQIEEKCMIYDATLTSNDGRVFSQKGIICKDE